MVEKTSEEIALERIEQAAQSKSPVLSLVDLSLESLPPEIGKLTHLRALGLGRGLIDYGNLLTSFPPEFELLTNLETLDITYNNLSVFPLGITRLHNLVDLNLSENQLTSLPADIKQLRTLTSLRLNDNKLTSIPPEIGQLANLTSLDLRNNKLTILPVEIFKLSNLKYLDLRVNNLGLPQEISDKINEPQKVLDFYKGIFEDVKYIARHESNVPDLAKAVEELLKVSNTRPINDAKLLVIGHGSAGKTSLIYRILHNTFNADQPKAEGITVHQWQLDDHNKAGSEISINIWDFPGQQITHPTALIFFTERSLYVLVADARLSEHQNGIEYWLDMIRTFSSEAPVIIVGNKIDQHHLDIDRQGLQKKYPNIVGIIETSAATGAGIEELKTAIIKQANKLPHVHELVPRAWFTLKIKLERLGHESNFIAYEKYIEVCAEEGIYDETTQRALVDFLHDIGSVLHFQKGLRLDGIVVLNEVDKSL